MFRSSWNLSTLSNKNYYVKENKTRNHIKLRCLGVNTVAASLILKKTKTSLKVFPVLTEEPHPLSGTVRWKQGFTFYVLTLIFNNKVKQAEATSI